MPILTVIRFSASIFVMVVQYLSGMSMKICSLNRICAGLFVLLGISMQLAVASEMTYTPMNPSFGGNPANATALLANANAQNTYKAPVLTPVQQFNASLQQAILSHVLSQAVNVMFPSGSKLSSVTAPVDTGAFMITFGPVTGDPNGVLITTTDKTTGAVSSFVVQSGL
jgi:curli production assembly/transport component CsgF